ncbi:hypothetical protein GGX14DRAFT_646109 [Mycena pura]|uniref:Uncharacterized protein n=1 Tax=Mycena pura TaxID=153505 RepID=A0AAD6V7L3_9AGAR|nr:hypothetical protein GGX14DRAFT_646109 [Mycena pura]
MMLVQKPPHFSMSLAQSPYLHTHRRHPSAPHPVAVVVQPTRTPGLLSLSKPARRPDHKPSPKPRQAPFAARSPRPAPAEATPPLKPAPEVRGPPEVRGRPQGKRQLHHPQQRSSSHAAPSRRRQPSPDPFKAAPAPAPPPSKRRQMPIPVPSRQAPANDHPLLSRSDPVLSHMPRRKPQRANTLDPYGQFPICDDMTDAGSRPSTPTPRSRPELRLSEPRTPTRRSRLPEPPLTAPISGATSASFPFPSTSTSTPSSSPQRRPAVAAARRAKHLSEGVMLPISFFPADDSPLLARRSRSSDRDDAHAPVDPSALPDGYFASSMFQNSPSPDELPPPLFS